MGCGASADGTRVHPFTGEAYEDDTDSIVDYSIGFSSHACARFGITENVDVIDLAYSNDREETDEFRVLRVSSLSGQVTLYVAGGKHKKPVQYDHDRLCPRAHEQPVHCGKCPFCVGNEAKTPPNVLSFDEDGKEFAAGIHHDNWKLRVFPNIFPMLICPTRFYGKLYVEALEKLPHSAVARGVHHNIKVSNRLDPTCVQVDAEGTSEVFVESNVHNALLALQEPKTIELLLKALRIRVSILSRESWVKQLLIFKQYGPLSGGSLVHPHTQVVSLPVLPPALVSRYEFAAHIYEKHQRCATCMACIDPYLEANDPAAPEACLGKSLSGSRSPKSSGSPKVELKEEDSRLVHMTDHFIVSVPYASSSQYSLTVAPRRHCAHFHEITDDEIKDLSCVLALLSQAIYKGLDDPSYNVFVRTAPADGGFKVGLHDEEVKAEDLRKIFHWIVEIRPRFPADLGGFEIASGIRVVSGLPEDHAADMRRWVLERIEAKLEPIKPEERKPSKIACSGSADHQHPKKQGSAFASTSSHLAGHSHSVPQTIGGRSKLEKIGRGQSKDHVERHAHHHATAPITVHRPMEEPVSTQRYMAPMQ